MDHCEEQWFASLFIFKKDGEKVTKRDYFNYANPKFSPLRDPMRQTIHAFWAAMHYFAAIKEVVWGRYGMSYLSDAIHTLEHKQPERIDQFSRLMRQQGLEIEYPGTPELNEQLETLDEVFRVCVELTDNIDTALQRFINVADRKEGENGSRPTELQGHFPALARQAEQLQIDNSADRTRLLEAWSMWGNSPSMSSFDKWVKSRYNLDDSGEADD